GQTVKKGDPLFDLFSASLAEAKNAYLTSRAQLDQDMRLLEERKRLAKTGAVSQRVLVDAQNDETKSRLNDRLARDRLAILGLSPDETAKIETERGEEKARFTLRAPVDGVVESLGTAEGDLCNPSTVLVVLKPTSR